MSKHEMHVAATKNQLPPMLIYDRWIRAMIVLRKGEQVCRFLPKSTTVTDMARRGAVTAQTRLLQGDLAREDTESNANRSHSPERAVSIPLLRINTQINTMMLQNDRETGKAITAGALSSNLRAHPGPIQIVNPGVTIVVARIGIDRRAHALDTLTAQVKKPCRRL